MQHHDSVVGEQFSAASAIGFVEIDADMLVPNQELRAPSIAPGTFFAFFVAQSWADCITNMAGFNLRQAQAATARFRIACPLCPAGITWFGSIARAPKP
jgi:hypothetical protein